MVTEFLAKCGLILPTNFDRSGKLKEVTARIVSLIEAADHSKRSRVMNDYERVAAMSDEVGTGGVVLGVCRPHGA